MSSSALWLRRACRLDMKVAGLYKNFGQIDHIMVDLKGDLGGDGTVTADMLISPEELASGRGEPKPMGMFLPPHQTPWQEIHRATVDRLGNGAVIETAVHYCAIQGLPRDNH
ncbi:hypothetical protein ABID19_005708 [Mesorhizobium robiniae]|uniref:Uncharacterized protein n=1 Tax=Mesorhizobium robiniae TaxID=559315 RepID=A0ABV2GWH7_9HYPH